MKMILGSGSKWRKLILEKAGYTFDVMTADIDEKEIRSSDYEELPLIIGKAKAEALLPQIGEPAILITSDQVVVCEGELWEKPKDEAEARKFFEIYSEGKPAQTNTSVVVINTENGKRAEGVDFAKTFFKEIPNEVIDKFIETGNAYACAGGFTVDDPLLIPYIDRIEGDRDSVEGLPMRMVEKLLNEVK
jgi:septum formation protein